MNHLIQNLESQIPDPKSGLPEEVFLLISRLTPLVNVDLLIQNEKQETLLTWRDDRFYQGWHFVGGILRFKEVFSTRLHAVARNELGASIEHEPTPLAVNQKINTDRDTRGHFISFLFRCKLTSPLKESLRCQNIHQPKPGEWAWHLKCPKTLIEQHHMYQSFFQKSGSQE